MEMVSPCSILNLPPPLIPRRCDCHSHGHLIVVGAALIPCRLKHPGPCWRLSSSMRAIHRGHLLDDAPSCHCNWSPGVGCASSCIPLVSWTSTCCLVPLYQTLGPTCSCWWGISESRAPKQGEDGMRSENVPFRQAGDH